jgi:polysaccharide biosynthesis transport protein
MEPAKNMPTQEATLHFLDYWRIIRIRKTVIISVFLLIAITATVVTFILPEYYSSTARIEINPPGTDITPMSGMAAGTGYDVYYIQTEFSKMQGEDVLGRVISSLNLNEEWGKKFNNGVPLRTEEAMQFLKNRMSLSPERNTKLIDITVSWEDPKEAALLANAIAQAYQDYRLALISTNAMRGIKALEDQYQAEERHIQEVQANVDQLRQTLGIVDTDPNSIIPSPTLSTVQVQKYNDEKVEDEKRYTEMQTTLSYLQAVRATNSAMLRDILPRMGDDASLSGLLEKLHTAQQTYVSLTNDYGMSSPEVTRAQSMIVELNKEIDASVIGVMAGMESKTRAIKAQLDQITGTVQSAISNDQKEAERGQPYWQAKRQWANLVDLHRLLQAKITNEKVDLTLPKTQMVTIVDVAHAGKAPDKPNKTLYISLGVIIGLLVGIGLAFFIEYLDTSVKTIDDVERALQAPVLGVIPQNVGILAEEGVESQHAEAYRVLRTNLLFSRKDDNLNTIVVVSAGAGEGKSTTAVNLATVFAQAGHRILLVDSDLRRPTMHKLLNVSNNLGLTNYLLKQNSLEEVIQRAKIPMLDVMASGKLPSSSVNVLGSAQMKEMIGDLKQRYDFIIFDSPPIMGVSDASILASEVDMVVQVIQYRRYPQPMNVRAKQLIEKVGGNLIGIVLNNINMSQDESYYYYSGYYHGYYYYSKNEQEQETEAKAPGQEGDTSRVGIKQKY